MVPRTDDPNDKGRRFKLAPEVQELAVGITEGLLTPEDKARAVEAHLRTEYSYSLSGMGRIGPDPMSWFLLRSKSGHCEYFAGAMVVLLQSVGVPARMVGGYSGGALSPDRDEAVVREANAHAWVEVWLGEDLGWRVFDPTPAANVPSLDTVTTRERIRFAWEWIQASWDRYILTFGLGEQMELLTAVGDRLAAAFSHMKWQAAAWLVGLSVVLGLVWRWARRVIRRSVPKKPNVGTTPAAKIVLRP
jgi:hypothetical protein